MIDIEQLPVGHVDDRVWRTIPCRYPQVDIFEQVSNPQDWEVLYAVESLTNSRLRDQVGDIRLVAPQDRVYGHGASWIMAPFTHPPVDGRGGRFNRDFGMNYCSGDEKVSVSESVYHQNRFLVESKIEEISVQMRVINAQLGPTDLHDLRSLSREPIFDPYDYSAAQQLGNLLKSSGSNGVQFFSVRATGECFGVMRPRLLSDAYHWRYLLFHFKNGKISTVEPITK